MRQNYFIGRTLCSFLLVLMLMPLGHALMILMEHFLSTDALHYSAFAMGLTGVIVAVAGLFVKGDTRQTIFGLAGGLLFWTGWVEFLFSYYAWRYGVHCDLVGSGIVETSTQYVDGIGLTHDFLINGEPLESFGRVEIKQIRGSRPEYLILPATFGLWAMFMMFYLLCTRTGCLAFNWMQRKLRIKDKIEARPLVRHSAMVTFMELNMLLWTCYLALMFCYDPIFLGSSHPVTFIFGVFCLIGSLMMFVKQMRISSWGANIRFSIATVIVLWTFVEIVARNGMLKEIWVEPMNYVVEMSIIFAAFIALAIWLICTAKKSKGA